MVSEDGDALFTSCDSCHIILAQGEEAQYVKNHEWNLPFVHPEDGDAIEEYSACPDCHTGGADLYD